MDIDVSNVTVDETLSFVFVAVVVFFFFLPLVLDRQL